MDRTDSLMFQGIDVTDLTTDDLQKPKNFKKKGGGCTPIYVIGAEVERAESDKFLGVTITDNLSWTSHVDTTVKKAQQRLFFVRWLRKFSMSIRTLTSFYRCTIESKLSGCITAWYGNC
eukprot:g39940.t1